MATAGLAAAIIAVAFISAAFGDNIMSFGLYPVFDPYLEDSNDSANGASLIDEIERLDAIAEKIGVIALSAYADTREVPEDFDGDPDELQDLLGPRTDWHNLSDGIASVSQIIAHLQQKNSRSEKSKILMEELLSLQQSLQYASQHRERFRLEAG